MSSYPTLSPLQCHMVTEAAAHTCTQTATLVCMQVDVVIQGHEHAYARTCPLAHGTCAADVATTPQQQGRTDSEQSGGRQLRADVRERGAAGRMSAAAAGDGDGEAAEGGVRGCLQSGRAGGPARAYAGERGGPVYLLTGHGGAGVSRAARVCMACVHDACWGCACCSLPA